MKISPNFSRAEFACKCGCGFATADIKLVELLEAVREHFKRPVIISSGCRCVKHNANVGGATKSKHLEGIAADIIVKGVEPSEVYEFLCNHVGPHWGGIGKYSTFTHIDSRIAPARWGK